METTDWPGSVVEAWVPRPCQTAAYPARHLQPASLSPPKGQSLRNDSTGQQCLLYFPQLPPFLLPPHVCPIAAPVLLQLPVQLPVTQAGKPTQAKNNLVFRQIILNPAPWAAQTVRTGLQPHTMDTVPSSFHFTQEVATLVNCCQLMWSWNYGFMPFLLTDSAMTVSIFSVTCILWLTSHKHSLIWAVIAWQSLKASETISWEKEQKMNAVPNS